MPLMNCPVCGRAISTEAEACPQCGHPNRPTATKQTGPGCYACENMATTRCQSCGEFSCPEHVQSIYVSHGRGGAYELRCSNCYQSAVLWKVVGWALILIVVGAIVIGFAFR